MSPLGVKAYVVATALLSLSACVTPRMHGQDELNRVGLSCGLALGELFQDEEAKKLLFVFREKPGPQQRNCVYQWASKRHLKLVIVDAIHFPEEK